MNKEAGKRAAALKAIDYVSPNMTLGLGTGSTAKYFVEALAPKINEGWCLKGVPTSDATDALARSIGIEIIVPDETTQIDLAVDGTDEADPDRNLIKGGGGALLREKIVASTAKKFVVIADKSKRVVQLGAFALPVEVDPFGWALTVAKMRTLFQQHGFNNPALELRALDGMPVKSDGNHLLIDCHLGAITDPAALDKLLTAIPGVIETGLFCKLADVIIYGDETGISVDGG